MKIYGKILALCAAFSYVSAFSVLEPKFTKHTSLSATDKTADIGGYVSKTYESLRDSITEESSDAALEARLDVLEKKQAASASQSSEAYSNKAQQIWDSAQKVDVQGDSLKTFSFPSPAVERVKVILKSSGRPLNADVDLWQGPDNTPVKMRVYLEDGSVRPFMASIETPDGSNTVAVRNLGALEFPMDAAVVASINEENPVVKRASDVTVQGGALKSFPFDPLVQSVQVSLKTDGRPLNARIELLQGPNNNKQVVELYSENGDKRPFFLVLETPGSGNVVRVLNTAPVEFPMTASIEPYHVGVPQDLDLQPVISGDEGW